MTTQDESDGLNAWVTAEAEARKRQAFLREFPGGVAPYSPGNLIALGFVGGIVGAGLAGALNLSRLRQSRKIPVLLLITLFLLAIFWVVTVVVADRFAVSFPQVDAQSIRLALVLVDAVLGMGFASLIARSQRTAWRRWRDLAGGIVQMRGGSLGVLSLLMFSFILTVVLAGIWNTLFLNTIFQTVYPQQRYTARNISVTVPAGWAQIDPAKLFLACKPPGLTCLAALSERSSDTDAEFLIVRGAFAQRYIDEIGAGIHRTNPSLPTMTGQLYSYPTLENRAAFTFDIPLSGRSLIVTSIADGAVVIIFYLKCDNEGLSSCEGLRDQFVSSLEYSAPPGLPDVKSFR